MDKFITLRLKFNGTVCLVNVDNIKIIYNDVGVTVIDFGKKDTYNIQETIEEVMEKIEKLNG